VKKVLFLMVIAAILVTVCQFQPIPAAPIDLRSRIDGTSAYSNSDSLEFMGSAAYDGYSDTVSVAGAELISADFILTRIATSATGIVLVLQGSKDKVNFTSLPCFGDTTKITSLGTRSFTFPYAAAFPYYRLAILSDTTFSAIVKFKVGSKVNR